MVFGRKRTTISNKKRNPDAYKWKTDEHVLEEGQKQAQEIVITADNLPQQSRITPDIAVAKAIENLTNTEILMLITNIPSSDDMEYLKTMWNIWLNFGNKKDDKGKFEKLLDGTIEFEWAKNEVYTHLMMLCSINGWKAEQLVTIARQPQLQPEEKHKFLGWLRGDRG